MLIVTRLGEQAGGYFLRGPATGIWIGVGAASLGLAGEVAGGDLRAVLAGRDPRDGRQLPIRRHPHRRAGWDLTFAAPKPLSLLAALAPAEAGAMVVEAHNSGVAGAVDYVERRACWARRDGRLIAPEGVIAAGYRHHHSAAGDPHLHTHVVMANLVCSHDGRWSALAQDPLWLTRGAVAALYQLSVADYLARHGLALGDLPGISRAVIDAASTRHGQIEADQLRRPETTSRSRRTFARQSRTLPGSAGPSSTVSDSKAASEAPWVARVAAAGFDRATAAAIVDEARRQPAPAPDPAVAARVTAALASRQSTFAVTDVLTALGDSAPTGIGVEAAEQWAEQYCRSSLLAAGGRWTSRGARESDDRLVAAGRRHAGRGVGVVTNDTLDAAMADRPAASAGAAGAARALVTGGDGVTVLAGAAGEDRWWSQAEALDLARAAWQATGYRVVVLAESHRAVRRWEALTAAITCPSVAALTEFRSPGVLIVDRADRRTTDELSQLISVASDHAAKLVLVVGGTQAARRHPMSSGLDDLSRWLGVVDIGLPEPLPAIPAPAVVHGNLSAALSGPGAAQVLLDRWEAAARTGSQPWLIGQGPAEVDVLNQAARARLKAAGVVHGPEVMSGRRVYQAGDRVVAVRQIAVAAGTVGCVTRTHRRGPLTVDWGHGPVPVDGHDAARISHAYATTPAMVRLVEGPLLVLGDPGRLGFHGGRVQHASLVIPERIQERADDRLSQLAARARSANPTPAPLPIGRPTAALAVEREQLTAALTARLPDDPARQHRRLDDDKGWLSAAAISQRQTALSRVVDDETRWLADRAPELRRWAQLGRAIDARRHGLDHLAATAARELPPRQRDAGRRPLELGW